MKAPECPRAGDFWGRRCKFMPRYHRGAPDPAAIGAIKSFAGSWVDDDDIAALNALCPQTYVYDICVRCGTTTEPLREGT